MAESDTPEVSKEADAFAPPKLDENAERRIAWWLVLVVLATLTAVKPLGGIAYVGAIAFTIAAIIQLYLPLWRADKLGFDYDFVGLHLKTWRTDLKIVLILMAITFPPYIIGHHLYMTEMRGWAQDLGLYSLARYLPQRTLNLSFPTTGAEWWIGTKWFLELVATHSLGVALPEETFYRGYLQPRLESLWPPVRRFLGVPLGRAAVLTCFLFAAGHFLGEWNPLRFGPFFPALIFAWQRNATGSVVGAIGYHAACNLVSEILSTFYQPG